MVNICVNMSYIRLKHPYMRILYELIVRFMYIAVSTSMSNRQIFILIKRPSSLYIRDTFSSLSWSMSRMTEYIMNYVP